MSAYKGVGKRPYPWIIGRLSQGLGPHISIQGTPLGVWWHIHLRQTLRRPRNPGCLGCATHNLPPLYRGVWIRGFGGTPPRQPSGPIVAQEIQEVARHRDTPKFCVRVIFDIYRHIWWRAIEICLF